MKVVHVLLHSYLVTVGIILFWCLQPLEWPNPTGSPQLIKGWGYPYEEHTVTTEDGYIIKMQRIPYGKGRKASPPSSPRPVVFLQHGLALESSIFLANLPDQSLGFMLADAGFDVWLGNNRGNTYGRNHIKYDQWQSAFWDFTWEDMANYDVPAQVNYVLNVTGTDGLHFIGHSQGVLTMFAHLSENDEMQKKIKQIFALAPALSVVNIRGPVAHIAPLAPFLHLLEFNVGPFGIFRRSIVNDGIAKMCSNFMLSGICTKYMYANGGGPSAQMNSSRLDVYMASYPDGTSTKNIVHFGQMVLQKRTAHFDYGVAENRKRYGSMIPPAYDFSRVKVPIFVWYSPHDYLTNDWDFHEIVFPSLDQNYLKMNTSLDDFNHFDFHWGLRAVDEIYRPIIKMISEY